VVISAVIVMVAEEFVIAEAEVLSLMSAMVSGASAAWGQWRLLFVNAMRFAEEAQYAPIE
jgi:hypothetical protein